LFQYENPNTHVFERMYDFGQLGKDKFPRLKRRHFIYKKIIPEKGEYKTTMECILTREIEGILHPVKSIYLVGMTFCGLMMMDMFVDT